MLYICYTCRVACYTCYACYTCEGVHVEPTELHVADLARELPPLLNSSRA